MKKKIISCFICVVFLCSVLVSNNFASDSSNIGNKAVKNVILLIPDGTEESSINLARWYQGGTPFSFDKYNCGLVRNYPADGIITDSAAAGSSYATGHKINSETVSIAPSHVEMPGVELHAIENQGQPLATIVEAAKLKGLATGIVSTSEFVDATPAVFASHSSDRHFLLDIAEQMVYNSPDVLLSAGTQFLVPGKDVENNRQDGEDLTKEIKANGYDYVTTKAGMLNSKSDKIWGLFGEGACDAEFDRDIEKNPSLAEMTQKAIDVLSKDKDGFFLMVESAQVDWFAHDGDPIGVISEVLAYDKAFEVAIDFALKDGNTAVIGVPDHGTGAIYLNNYGTLKDLNGILHMAKNTTYGFEDKITEKNFKEVIAKYYGIKDIKKEEEARIIKAIKTGEGLNTAIGALYCSRAEITMTTGDHTAEDVNLFAYHPAGFKPTDYKQSGTILNCDVGKYMQYILGLDCDALTKTLYVSDSSLKKQGAKVTVDKKDPKNPVVVITKGSKTLKLPINKNIAIINGKVTKLDSLTLLIKDKIWVSGNTFSLIE